MNFGLYLDPDSPVTPEESKRMKEVIQVCGSPKRAALALLRLTHSLAYDLTSSQALLGNPLLQDVHYAAPSEYIERGEHMHLDKPKASNRNAAL